MTTPAEQKQAPAAAAAAAAAAASVSPGVIHCEHGGPEAEQLVAAPQLTALPTLEPLALDVGGPPPSSLVAATPAPAPTPLKPPPLPLPRSPPPQPQDDVAGTAEDVEDVAAVMSMTGGGGGPGGAVERGGGDPHPPTTPAAAAAAPPAAAAASPAAAPAWQAASLCRVASAREGVFATPAPGDDDPQQQQQQQPPPAWLASGGAWPVTAPQLLLLARDAVATGVHESPLLDRRPGAFEFSAPFVGPIRGADRFAETMREVAVDDAFDVAPQTFGFAIDPLEPGRVWFLSRPRSAFVRPLKAGGPLLPPIPPTGEVVRSPPQVASLKFAPRCGEEDDDGGGGGGGQRPPLLPPVRAVEFTYGYVCDRRQGDTCGLGGAFGIMYAAGRPFPFPEGRPWRSSWQQTLFNRGGALGRAAAWAIDRALQVAWPFGGAPVARSRNTM